MFWRVNLQCWTRALSWRWCVNEQECLSIALGQCIQAIVPILFFGMCVFAMNSVAFCWLTLSAFTHETPGNVWLPHFRQRRCGAKFKCASDHFPNIWAIEFLRIAKMHFRRKNENVEVFNHGFVFTFLFWEDVISKELEMYETSFQILTMPLH